jgi:hypothetical protein
MSTNVPLPPEALDEWLAALAAHLDLDADVVPTNVARPAAPLSLFLVGLAAARNGGSAEDIAAASAAATELALRWPAAPQ